MNPSSSKRTKLWWPILGFFSLVWFLFRVIPKPSRAAYPCMRVAFPIASTFVIWLSGLGTSVILFRKAKKGIRESRPVMAGICIIVAITAAWISFNGKVFPTAFTETIPSLLAEETSDPVNDPIGEPKGCNPGRVVWVHDPDATDWDGPVVPGGEPCWR